MNETGKAWMVSLHGGHSGEFCEHAQGTLEATLEAAIAAGYHTFGVSEHAPRLGERFLYVEEVAGGWDVARLEADFHAYAKRAAELVESMAGRLVVLRGFETEAVPSDRYVEIMRSYRERYAFDFMVGSVHHVNEIGIDGPMDEHAEALERAGGQEALALQYYADLADMIEALEPDVVSHFDLVRKNAPSEEAVDTPAIRQAAYRALDAARDRGCILDLNLAGYRRCLNRPYPAAWIVERAVELGVPFCFGDDSHSPEQVGAGIEDGRQYLLSHGVRTIAYLTREDGAIVRKTASLE